MGVLVDYAQARIVEMRQEAKHFKQNPATYIRDKQPVRTALLLEWLDYIRPAVGTRWEHKIEQKMLK